MARRRMYLFERAYVDYADHFRGFLRKAWLFCSSTWRFFWNGPGGEAIEKLLRVAIVATVIVLIASYFRYEQAHGRGVSGTTVFFISALGLYASIVLWSWKAPLHFAARTVSGLAAAGSILLVAAVAFTPAGSIFSIYLLALALSSALSLVVFLPMRGAHALWLLYRRIAYRCPYDDDSGAHGLPIHVCSCGTWYDDLRPSFYGIFHHVCRHDDGEEVRLPTMDFLGRNKLPRLCRGCRRPLAFSSIGELAERPLSVVGGPGAGKTVFLRQATRALREHLSAQPKSKVYFDSPENEREFEEDLQLLDRGQVPAKTVGDVMQAFALAVRIPKRLRCLLYLYDAPGEDFLSREQYGRKQVLQHTAGLVLLVDPFSLPTLAEHGRRQPMASGVSPTPFQQVVDVLVAGVNQRLVRRPTDRCGVPLAVVLGKADALPFEDFPFLNDLCPGPQSSQDDARSNRCRQALMRLGASNGLRALEQKFSRVRYFACSALGRSPEDRRSEAFRPRGVLEPLLWLLELELPGQAGDAVTPGTYEMAA